MLAAHRVDGFGAVLLVARRCARPEDDQNTFPLVCSWISLTRMMFVRVLIAFDLNLLGAVSHVFCCALVSITQHHMF